eukprot:1316010-Prymnesium_polylepis.1
MQISENPRPMAFRVGDKVAMAPCPPVCEAAWVLNSSAAHTLTVTNEEGSADEPKDIERRNVVAWGGRFSMAVPQVPAGLLFLHLEKTGGTSVRTWLKVNEDTSLFHEPARLQLVSSDCFEAMTPSWKPDHRGREDGEEDDHGEREETREAKHVQNACPGPVQPVAWDRSITAVEYHIGAAKQQFWRHVRHARELYAKAGGQFLTAVLLQEP